MKVLLYTEGMKTIGKSGLGKAIQHQIRALESNGITYTTDSKEKGFDIAHINFYGPKSFLLARKLKRQGIKIIYHAHSTEEDFKNSFIFSNQLSPLFKWWICKCYNLGDSIITPTIYSKKLLTNYGIKRPIYAISNGIDTKFFERDVELGKNFRETYHYSDEDKVVVGIGLYIERKGILDFVEMAKRLPQYKFIWFGSSPLSASPQKIRDAVHTKLPNLVFAGYVEQKMIHAALSGANLFFMPTQEETEGIPIMEASISKIPTLIRDIPIFEDWFKDNVDIYKGKTLDEFESKIQQILEGQIPNLVDNAYHVAKKRDVKIAGEQLITAYTETLDGTQQPDKIN